MDYGTFHPMSQPGMSEALDSRNLPVTDLVPSSRYYKSFPIASIGPSTKVIEFDFPADRDRYIDPSSTVLKIGGKFVYSGDTAKKAVHVDAFLSSLMDCIKVYINGVKVCHHELSWLSSWVDILTTTNEQTRKTGLAVGGFNKAKCGKSETLTIPPGEDFGGMKERMTTVSNKKYVEFIGSPFCSFTQLAKYLPPGLSLKFEFYLNKPEFILIEENSTSPHWSFEISKAELDILMLDVPQSIRYSLEQWLTRSSLWHVLRNLQAVKREIPIGSTSAVLEIIGEVYEKLYCVFLSAAASKGLYDKDPLVLKHFSLKKGVLSVGGDLYTQDLDFDEGQYKHSYLELLRSFPDSAIPYPLEDYTTDCFVHCFNVKPPSRNNNALSTRRITSSRLYLEFKTATTEQVSVVLLSDKPQILEINKHRDITIHE